MFLLAVGPGNADLYDCRVPNDRGPHGFKPVVRLQVDVQLIQPGRLD